MPASKTSLSVLFLGEAITLRLTPASSAIRGGIALVILENRPPGKAP